MHFIASDLREAQQSDTKWQVLVEGKFLLCPLLQEGPF